MSLLVITDEGNGSHAIYLAEEGMFENQIAKALLAVGGAKCLEVISRAVEILERYFPGRCVHRFHRFGSIHPLKPQGNDRGRYQPPQEPDSSRLLGDSTFELMDYSGFNEAKVLHNFANTPFTCRRLP